MAMSLKRRLSEGERRGQGEMKTLPISSHTHQDQGAEPTSGLQITVYSKDVQIELSNNDQCPETSDWEVELAQGSRDQAPVDRNMLVLW